MSASYHDRGPSSLATLLRFAHQVPGTPARVRELRGLLDDVADVPWHNPVWSGIVAGCALFERFGQPLPVQHLHALWMSGDGSPRIDTFMGRRDQAGPLTTARRIARAVVRARAAVDALAALDGTLPDQPLHQLLTWDRRWLCRQPVEARDRVGFLTERGAYLARIVPGDELALARELAALAGAAPAVPRSGSQPRLVPIDLDAPTPTPTAIMISLLDAPLDCARHLHRQVWSRGGGPWLGVGSAPPFEITTTCHLITDGTGHGLVTAGLFERLDGMADLEQAIAAALAPLVPGFDGSAAPHYRWRHTAPQGVAPHVVDGRVSFAEAAYAFGRCLSRVYGASANFSPTFQIPVASPPAAGEARHRRRIVQGLASVRRVDHGFESFAAFSARLPALLDRERRGDGPLTRMMQAAACTPAPRWLLRRYLAAPQHPGRWSTLKEVLGGRGVLSSMRAARPGGAQPLYAAAAPPLLASRDDPRGAVLLTLIHHDDLVTATTTGSGLAASHDGAHAILRVWVDELDRLRATADRPRAVEVGAAP